MSSNFLVLAAVAALPALYAQEPPHIVESRGDVAIHRGDPTQPVAAPLDSPLAAGDRIVTGKKGRATVALDASHGFRLDSESELRVVYAENDTYELSLVKGSLDYHVDPGSAATVSVNTPQVWAKPYVPGQYRIAITRAGESEVYARSGDLQVFAVNGTEWVHPGRKLIARGAQGGPEFKVVRVGLIRQALLALRMGIDIASSISAGGGSDDSSSSNTNSGHHDSGSGAHSTSGSRDSVAAATSHGSQGSSQPASNSGGRGK